ncbi:MAG: hypothetical protein IIB39_01220 [Candidatus Marinimicrobia bacterium]|nr:hypothetical protein [Candidatus Neomarinimicrobiota bacterium]
MSKIHLNILLLLIFVPQGLVAQDDWKVFNEGFIRIQYHDYDVQLTNLVVSTILNNINRISEDIGYDGPPIANIIISGSQKEFDGFTGNILPSWSQGSTDYSKSLIVLKSTSFSKATKKELERTITHELTHFLIGAVIDAGKVPRWFNEGLATFLAGGETFRAKILLSRALFTKSLIKLNDVQEVLSFDGNKANLAYAQSRAAIVFLKETAGKDVIKFIFENINLNNSFEAAFTEVTGTDLLDFEIDLRRNLKNNYRYYFLAAVNDYIWILIPVLLLLAYIAVKHKNWKIVRKWDAEREEENGATG